MQHLMTCRWRKLACGFSQLPSRVLNQAVHELSIFRKHVFVRNVVGKGSD